MDDRTVLENGNGLGRAAKITISSLLSKFDSAPKRRYLDWDELHGLLSKVRRTRCTVADCEHSDCVHKNGAAWSPARFPVGGKRKQDVVESVSVLVGDLDHLKDDDLAAAEAKISAYRRIVHPSHSDRPGDRCVRAVIALSRAVKGDEWTAFWPAAMDMLGLAKPADSSCRDANRLYYLPSRPSDADYWCRSESGIALDVDAVLASAPQEQPTIADSLELDETGAVGPGQRHAMLASLAGAMRMRGCGKTEIEPALLAANKARCNPPKPEAECKELAAWAAGQPVSSLPKDMRAAIEKEIDEFARRDVDPWEQALATALADVKRELGKRTAAERKPLFTDAGHILQQQFEQPPWLVTGLITDGGLAVIGAEPKTVKTWLATEIAIAVATGTKVCGEFFAKQGTVAYFYAEDSGRQVKSRLRSLLAGAGRTLPAGSLHACPRSVSLDVMSDEDLAWIVASCRRIGKIDLCALDPMRDVHTAKENDNDEMAAMLRRLFVLGRLLGCTVLVIHHYPKATGDTKGRRIGQGLRGASAIHGKVDSGLYLSSAKGGDGTNVFVTRMESQIKGARSAGVREIKLEIDDDDQLEAINAAWTVSRPATKAESQDDEATIVVTWICELGKQNISLTKTELKERDDRPVVSGKPIGQKRLVTVVDEQIDAGKLLIVAGKVCPSLRAVTGNAND